MSYTLDVNAAVSGQGSLSALTSATEKQTGATSAMNNALYGADTAQQKYTLGAQKLAIEQAKIEQLTIQYRIALLGQTTATDSATSSTERLSGATAGATGNVRNMTAALRGLEGAMPIRSAAQFLSSIQGINTAMQFAFPVFGAIALIGVLDTIIDKVGKWADAHDPVLKAQESSLSLLKSEGEEYDKLAGKVRELNREKLKRQFGPGFVDRLDAADAARAAGHEDQDQIDKLLALQAQVNRIAGANTSTYFRPGVGMVPQSLFRPGDVGLAARIAQATGKQDDDKFKTGLEGIGEGEGITQKQSDAAKSFHGLDAALETARKQQVKDLAEAGEKTAAGDKEDRTKAAEAQRKLAEALRKREAQENRITEIEKRAADEMERASGKGEGPLGRFTASLGVINNESSDEERQNPGFDSRIERARQTRGRAALQTFRAEQKKGDEEYDTKNPAEELVKHLTESMDKIFKAEVEGKHQTGIGDLTEGVTIAAPAGYQSPQQQLRDARDNERRGMSQLSLQNRLSGASGQQSAESNASARLFYANEEFAAQMREANAKGVDSEKARLDAIDQLKEKKFDIEMERENELLDIALKQKQEASQMAGGLFDALRSRSTGSWFKDFAVGQGKQLFTNAATPILEGATHALGSVIPASAQTGALGSLLHGTVFDSANAAPQQTANNTLETVKQVLGLRGDLKGIFTGNSDPNAQVQPGGSGGGSGFNPFMGSSGGLMGTGIGAGSTSLYNLPNTFNAFGPNLSSTSALNAGSSVLAQFASGVSGGPSMALARLLGTQPPAGTVGWGTDGLPHDASGTPIASSTPTTIGQGVSVAAAVAAGTISAIKSFEKGGASGALGGVAALAGMASLIPGAGLIAAPIAAVTGLLSAVLSTGPQQRSQQITDYINKDAYLAPTALNVTQGMNGTYEDFDARGNIRTSNLSAVPTVAEPYITKRTLNGQQGWYDAPGVVTAPYSGSATGTGLTPVSNAPGAGGGVTNVFTGPIQTMDSESFHSFLQKPGNSMAVGESLANHLQSHEGRASNAIRYVAGA